MEVESSPDAATQLAETWRTQFLNFCPHSEKRPRRSLPDNEPPTRGRATVAANVIQARGRDRRAAWKTTISSAWQVDSSTRRQIGDATSGASLWATLLHLNAGNLNLIQALIDMSSKWKIGRYKSPEPRDPSWTWSHCGQCCSAA